MNHRKKHEFSMFLELDGSANVHPMNQGKQRGENVLLQITASMVKTYFCGKRATSLWYLLVFSSLAPVFYLLTASLPFRSFHLTLYHKFRKKICSALLCKDVYVLYNIRGLLSSVVIILFTLHLPGHHSPVLCTHTLQGQLGYTSMKLP